jgi:hypothetical protein
MPIEQAYKIIKNTIPNTKVDSFNVIQKVEEYRQFWKPEKTNLILLAESHVYTDDYEFEVKCNRFKLEYFIKNYPTDFVRFIYCLAYGESDLLNKNIGSNRGTPDYWKIFASSIAKGDSDLGFNRILKEDNPYFPRLRNKVNILQEMKRRGIWLLDASLVGIYKAIDAIHDNVLTNKQRFEIKKTIFTICWDNHLRDIIAEEKPKHVIVIGKGYYSVEGILEDRLRQIKSILKVNYTVLPQPQGVRLPSEGQMEVYRQYQRICSK